MERIRGEELAAFAESMLESGMQGISIAHTLTEKVDGVLTSLYNARAGSTPRLALLAIGGYGRQELAPFSDVDIMLLAKNRSAETTEKAHELLYRFWDSGLTISHSFRTLEECLDDSLDDVKTRTSLIDARYLAGDVSLFSEFTRDTSQKLLFRHKKEFIADQLREIEKRHKVYGESLYLLEPNVKEGRGGLRDIHSALWLAKVGLNSAGIKDIRALTTEMRYRNFIKAFDFMLRVRLALHILSRRRNDILSFEYQRPVAGLLHLHDTKRFLAEEILLRLFYKKANDAVSILKTIRIRCGARYAPFSFPFYSKKITDDFSIAKNEIIVRDKNTLSSVDKIMEAFYHFSVSGKRFSYDLKETIRMRALFVNKKTRVSKKAKRYFLDILKGERVYETLKEMHETTVLDRFIPEFGRLRHLVIYEPYHRYTVDEHILIAIRNLEQLKNTKQAGLQYLEKMLSGVKQEVLFLSLLLHDIGKGVSKRHEEAGYKLIKGVLERFDFSADERQQIEFLIRNHILLAKLALNRDLSAPETLTQLAEVATSEENLSALYLMTYADTAAVNPHFWNEWKAYLLHELYTKTRDYLRGISRSRLDGFAEENKELLSDMPERYLLSNTEEGIEYDRQLIEQYKEHDRESRFLFRVREQTDGAADFIIITSDHPGLFSQIVGALSLNGLNILRARLYTGKSGLVIDKLLLSNWKDVWWPGLEEKIQEDLEKTVHKDTPPPVHRASYPAAHKRFEHFIEIDNETSDSSTICEVFSSDRLWLLYDIATEFYKKGVNILSAVINTEEGVAQDIFYLQYNGKKLTAETTEHMLGALQGIIDL